MEITASNKFHNSLRRLCDDSKARTVVVLRSDGNLVDASGEIHKIDLTSIAALASGVSVTASALAEAIEAGRCNGIAIEGNNEHLYVTNLTAEEMLIVIYGSRTNEGIVRLRVKQYRRELERTLEKLSAKSEASRREPKFEDLISKKKKENLFEALSDAEIDDALGLD